MMALSGRQINLYRPKIMIRCIFFLLFLSGLCADILDDLHEHLPEIIKRVDEVQGDFLKVEPLPDTGGSFINSVFLVSTTAQEELVLKVENPNWKNKKTLNEVVSIRFLDQHTSIPVPHILLFEDNLERSPFSAEYILMNRIDGIPLNHEIEKIYKDRPLYTELLSNLADILAELKEIRFDSVGNFTNFEKLEVGGIVDFPTYTVEKPCASFSKYASHWLRYYQSEMERLSQCGHRNSFIFQKYLPIMEKWLAEDKLALLDTPADIFVYSHLDFVMKNILVDGAKIKAILDWEWSGSALPEFEGKTGLDFLLTEEDQHLFGTLLKERGMESFFDAPPANRQLFYKIIGDMYALISCYEWIEGKLEHTAKFLDQKLEQRMVKAAAQFDMEQYLEAKVSNLDECIRQFEAIGE